MATGTSIRANVSFRHCDIEHSRDGQDNWYDANGRDGGGNIDETPVFRDEAQPAGTSGNIWMTADDGLRLQNTSPCIDRADGDFAPEKDVLGVRRYDELTASGGVGQPDYVDIGAYEYRRRRISGGEKYTLMLEVDGTLWGCGDNGSGQLGIGMVTSEPELTVVHVKEEKGLGYLKDVSFSDAGFYHSLAVAGSQGYAMAWGRNTHGQIGNSSVHVGWWNVQPIPLKVLAGQQGGGTYLHDIVKVSAGRSGEYSLACDRTNNRYVWAWGLNDTGQLGNHNDDDQPTPVSVVKVDNTALTGIVDIEAGISHSIGLDQTGDVWTWGWNTEGQLGDGGSVPGTDRDYAKMVPGLSHIIDVAVSCGLDEHLMGYGGCSYGLEDAPGVNDGYVWAWGSNAFDILGQGPDGPLNSATPLKVLAGQQGGGILHDIVAVSAGNYHVLALDKNGNVWAWGNNSYGQLGKGDFVYNYSGAPVRVKKPGDVPLTNIVTIDAGFEHSLAIDRDDNVWVWGRNDEGQLGLGYNWPDREPYAIEMP